MNEYLNAPTHIRVRQHEAREAQARAAIHRALVVADVTLSYQLLHIDREEFARMLDTFADTMLQRHRWVHTNQNES